MVHNCSVTVSFGADFFLGAIKSDYAKWIKHESVVFLLAEITVI